MSEEKFNISSEVKNLEDYFIKTRRFLHQHPEPSLKEYETSKLIKKELEKEGISYVKVGDTGVLATIKGEHPGKTILLRADMDALELKDRKDVAYRSLNEGNHHACGHDAHTATLLGLAKILNKNKDKIYGKVKLCFQQAEEIGAGARLFVKEGHLKDVDFALGVHNATDIEYGKVSATPGATYASCDIFTIEVKGECSHAAHPHLGKDAAVATANILIALQNIVSRQRDPQEALVISVGYIEAGTRYNVVAGQGVLKGTLRTLNPDLRPKILRKIEEVAKLTAQINNCQATFENYDAASVLVNDKEVSEYEQFILADIIGKENVIVDKKATLGAEDFADYSRVVPACFLNVGSRSGPETSYPHHHELFDLDERYMLIAAQTFLDSVYRWHEYFK